MNEPVPPPAAVVIEVSELSAADRHEYAAVSIAYCVTHRVVAETTDGGGLRCDRVDKVAIPYWKDYDALPGMSPLAWADRSDFGEWGLFVARRSGFAVAGIAIAPWASGLGPATAPRTSATVFDLRVAPNVRGRGVGTALFHAAEQWAVGRGHDSVMVESQDVNVAACRFYQKMDCRLATFDQQDYPEVPGEKRLVWHRSLEIARS